MSNKEQIIELLEKISDLNDQVLALVKKEEPTAEPKPGSQPDPPGTGGGG